MLLTKRTAMGMPTPSPIFAPVDRPDFDVLVDELLLPPLLPPPVLPPPVLLLVVVAVAGPEVNDWLPVLVGVPSKLTELPTFVPLSSS